jgi:hypothetical protein
MINNFQHGGPQTYFQGRGQNFSKDHTKTYFLPKNDKKTYNFPQKAIYILFLADQGGKSPLVPSPFGCPCFHILISTICLYRIKKKS